MAEPQDVELKLVRIGMNMEEATLVAWRKAPGESFAEGETIYEIETEKVVSEVQAPFSGAMLEHMVGEGDTMEVGDVVCKVRQAS